MVTCKYKEFKLGSLFKCLIFSMSFENFEYIILIIGGFTFSRLTNSENSKTKYNYFGPLLLPYFIVESDAKVWMETVTESWSHVVAFCVSHKQL